MHIRDWETWPPGSTMVFRYKVAGFVGLGLVVANDRLRVTVVWSGNCKDAVTTYRVCHLNSEVITTLRSYRQELKKQCRT